MDLEAYITEAFPQGLPYNEAAQLCLRLYRNTEGVPEELHKECSKDGLAEVFARLAARGFLTTEPLMAALYGANFHRVEEKGHWIEIIASIFKAIPSTWSLEKQWRAASQVAHPSDLFAMEVFERLSDDLRTLSDYFANPPLLTSRRLAARLGDDRNPNIGLCR